MATIDVRSREIHAKIVYYGPGLSGKTTNVRNIHERMLPEFRGPMKSIETDLERTLFFDFLATEPIRLGGWAIRYHVYTVPGQDDYARTRRAILGGSDGVVFVADSTPSEASANLAFLTELGDHLEYYDRDVAMFPLVFQFNKMDLSDAAARMNLEVQLNPDARPSIDAIALQGNGVRETLSEIMRLVTQTL